VKLVSKSIRRSAVAFAVMSAIGASAALNAAPRQSDSFATIAAATNLRSSDTLLGALPATTAMHIEVSLKLRNRDLLDAYIAGLGSVVSNPNARSGMSSTQFMAQHAPTQDQAKAVVDYLKNAGFTNIVISANRLLVSADGTAASATSAFTTSFSQVRTADGRTTYANTSAAYIPAALQSTILAVVGLQDARQAKVHSHLVPDAVTGHNPKEFASIYGGTGAVTGAGVTVGIITQGKITQTITDLNSFTSGAGFPTVTTQTINTNGTSTDASGVGEWNLDSQDIVGMAGGQVGKILFYNIPTLSNANLTADINKVVTDNLTKIINVSLGECETDAHGDGSSTAQDQSFAQAVAQGQTFSISTGDDGADECGTGGVVPSWPAASQYVIAASGTKLDASTTTWNSEVVWNDLAAGNGATGGSMSTFEPKPSWQTLWSGARRGVADIAFDASPSSGAKVIVSGATQQIGGTSLAAPLFSGFWTRVIAAKGTSVGFAGPAIYGLPAADFHDVTSGNNSGSTAGAGYDLATGRGSILMASAISHIGGTTPPTNTPPVANFSVATNGLTATFTDSSTDSDGSIASRSWNFGDSSTSTTTSPSHTYAAAGTYSVSETVTDNQGATNTKTTSVTVSVVTGNVLQNGVAVTGIAGATNADVNYTMVVPAGATNLNFVMSGGTGDADMYVKFGAQSTSTVYDCRPYKTGNAETCTFAAPSAGTYYVRLHGYAAFTGVSLTGSYTTGGGGGTHGTFSNTTAKAIPDSSSITSTIAVTGITGNAPTNLSVSVNITHTYRGDLKIDLVSPSGTTYNLKASSGSDSADNVVATYVVNAATSVANGTWTLKVTDTAAGDTGTLNNWSVTF
jgi:subtilase family serine protease